jgi:hypothetical protein
VPLNHVALHAWLSRTSGLGARRVPRHWRALTEDATYQQAPYEKPVVGLDAIAAMWEPSAKAPMRSSE